MSIRKGSHYCQNHLIFISTLIVLYHTVQLNIYVQIVYVNLQLKYDVLFDIKKINNYWSLIDNEQLDKKMRLKSLFRTRKKECYSSDTTSVFHKTKSIGRPIFLFVRYLLKPMPFSVRAYRSLSEFRFRSPCMVVTVTGMILLHRQKKYKSNLQKSSKTLAISV